MSNLQWLAALAGKWTARYRLFLPPSPPFDCDSVAAIVPALGGSFVRIDYTWAHEGKTQEGMLLLGHDPKAGTTSAVWIDSWHMGNQFMTCRGASPDGGRVEVRGSYAAPPGPDWGWRTVIERVDRASFRLTMYNVTPDGQEELAVEAHYRSLFPP